MELTIFGILGSGEIAAGGGGGGGGGGVCCWWMKGGGVVVGVGGDGSIVSNVCLNQVREKRGGEDVAVFN